MNTAKTVVGTVVVLGAMVAADKENMVSKSIYYDKTEFYARSMPCEPAAVDCIQEIYNAPLRGSDDAVIGNVQFVDVLQKNGAALYVNEQASYQFTHEDYVKYFQYQYAFESSTGDSFWPDGYTVDVNAYSSAGNVDVHESLVVMSPRRNIDLTFATESKPQNTMSTRNIYYDKKDFVSWVGSCDSTKTDCFIEYYNAPLMDSETHAVVGNVQFHDVVMNYDTPLYVSEWASYQFTDNGDIKYFAYNYEFESQTGSSVWGDGYKVDVTTFSSDSGEDIREVLEVQGDLRNIQLSYGSKRGKGGKGKGDRRALRGKGKGKGKRDDDEQEIYYDKTEFVSWAEPCESGNDGCVKEIYNAPLYGSDDAVVGNVQFFDILQKNGAALYVYEQATYTFTNDDYVKYFQYHYAFESSTGDSIWPDGYTVDVNSYSSAGDEDVHEVLVVEGNRRNIKLN